MSGAIKEWFQDGMGVLLAKSWRDSHKTCPICSCGSKDYWHGSWPLPCLRISLRGRKPEAMTCLALHIADFRINRPLFLGIGIYLCISHESTTNWGWSIDHYRSGKLGPITVLRDPLW